MAIQRFPGFIDVHVHLREPGATHKEDFLTGSKAAIAGGFTFVCDMPNNPGKPTISIERLVEKIQLSQSAICDIGFHYGTDGNNLDSFPLAWKNPHVFGLKNYCNHTTGELLVDDVSKIFAAWNSEKPVLVHAEGEKVAECIELAKFYNRRLHVCHVSQISEIDMIRKAPDMVTAGVTPHHLFLDKAVVKPDIDPNAHDALWEALVDGTIDIVESDHAPHLKSENGTFGVPGLETTVGLLIKELKKKKQLLSYLVTWLYVNPKKIFHIPDQPNTYIELDPEKLYIVGADGYKTKCNWNPFDGWELYGKVQTVILRGVKLL